MEVIIALLYLVWAILCLILFFKIWVATNDIAEMKRMMQSILLNKGHAAPSPAQEVYSSLDSSDDSAVSQSPKQNLRICKGDYVIRNFDGKEYEVEDVRPNGVLIYLGLVGGYRTLAPDEFTLPKRR